MDTPTVTPATMINPDARQRLYPDVPAVAAGAVKRLRDAVDAAHDLLERVAESAPSTGDPQIDGLIAEVVSHVGEVDAELRAAVDALIPVRSPYVPVYIASRRDVIDCLQAVLGLQGSMHRALGQRDTNAERVDLAHRALERYAGRMLELYGDDLRYLEAEAAEEAAATAAARAAVISSTSNASPDEVEVDAEVVKLA